MMGNEVPCGGSDDAALKSNLAMANALSLAKQALATLDAGGAGFTSFACHLSQAIDLAEEQPLPRTEQECQSMLEVVFAETIGADSPAQI